MLPRVYDADDFLMLLMMLFCFLSLRLIYFLLFAADAPGACQFRDAALLRASYAAIYVL